MFRGIAEQERAGTLTREQKKAIQEKRDLCYKVGLRVFNSAYNFGVPLKHPDIAKKLVELAVRCNQPDEIVDLLAKHHAFLDGDNPPDWRAAMSQLERNVAELERKMIAQRERAYRTKFLKDVDESGQ